MFINPGSYATIWYALPSALDTSSLHWRPSDICHAKGVGFCTSPKMRRGQLALMWLTWPQWKQTRAFCLQSLPKCPFFPHLRHEKDQHTPSWNFPHIPHLKLPCSIAPDVESAALNRLAVACDYSVTNLSHPFWISIWISLFLAFYCNSIMVRYWVFATNSLISVLSILK